MQYLLEMKDKERSIVTRFLWVWRDARNKANANNNLPTVEEVMYRTMVVVSSSAYLPLTKEVANLQRHDQKKWRPPPPDVLKINLDGSFREHEKDGAWGFIIRDNEGHGVLAGSGRLSAVHDALSAEGEACLAALLAAMTVGISQSIIETDPVNLATALQSVKFDQAPGGVIFKEARDLLDMHFQCV